MANIDVGEIRVQGVRSLLRTGGPSKSGEAIVFVHGNPGSSEDWADLLPHAAELGRVIAPDMPGYGKADRPADFDYTVAGYSKHLAGMLQQLGVQRAHLVLHDFGGPWGLHWASQHPQQVASVTLLNIGVLPGYSWHKYARIWRTPLVGELFSLMATRGAFRTLINADNPKPFPDAFVDRMFDDSDWGQKRAVLKLYRATSNLGAMAEQFGAALKPLHLPALVLWGDGDKYLPVRYADVQKDYFRAETHVLSGCGHWPMIDEPEQVRALVIPFLEKQLAARGAR
jgi:pimeloyl-ACP methyl ester carboxylesterase